MDEPQDEPRRSAGSGRSTRAGARFRCSSRCAPESLLDSASLAPSSGECDARPGSTTAVPARRLAASPAARGDRTARLDPVTAEIIRGAMETICYEVATYVGRAATTPVLNQSGERNATILDARGRLAALSVTVPQLMLSSTLPVHFALDFFGPGGLEDGDVLIANDPYHGGGHLADYNVFAPVVVDGELRFVVAIQCHHADTGGAAPGGYMVDALDIWAEGVRLPAAQGRGARRGALRRSLHDEDEQSEPDLPRRPARADRRGAARSRPPQRLDREVRPGRGSRLGGTFDRAGARAVSRGGAAMAGRRLLRRRLRRQRSARQHRHTRAPQGHGARRSPHRRLHRIRHAAESVRELDLRQYARLRRGSDRQHDGPDDSRRTKASSNPSTSSFPRDAASIPTRTSRSPQARSTRPWRSARESPGHSATCRPSARARRSTSRACRR